MATKQDRLKLPNNKYITGNAQADWNQSDNTKEDYIKNKPISPSQRWKYTFSKFAYNPNVVIDNIRQTNGATISFIAEPENPFGLNDIFTAGTTAGAEWKDNIIVSDAVFSAPATSNIVVYRNGQRLQYSTDYVLSFRTQIVDSVSRKMLRNIKIFGGYDINDVFVVEFDKYIEA